MMLMEFADLSQSDCSNLGHVTGQGSMSPTEVGRVSDPGKITFHKSVKTWITLLYI